MANDRTIFGPPCGFKLITDAYPVTIQAWSRTKSSAHRTAAVCSRLDHTNGGDTDGDAFADANVGGNGGNADVMFQARKKTLREYGKQSGPWKRTRLL
ncbi:MAG: hypothetical protein WCI78_17140, partial [Mycobacterium sp.]